MKDKNNLILQKSLQQLEQLARKIIETRGYTSESEKIRALEEIIKEQIINENSRHTTRQTR